VNSEIIGVGTELLLGQIANTNAQRISQRLAEVGVDVFRHSAVGDNLDRMKEAISEALGRADVVIVTGGLGPTPDDITRDAVAAVLDRPLERHAGLVTELKEFFAGRGRDMPDSNLRQADIPKGATVIEPEGTAPGFYVEEGARLLVALPGVPWEMEQMMSKAVVPLLRTRAGDAATVSREVLGVGLGESHTHRQIADLVDAQTNPTIAYLAGHGLVRVRITAKGPNAADALALIEPIEAEVRSRLGQSAVPGHGSLAQILGDLLRAHSATVATAESLTGGLIGAELTKAEGASDFFAGAAVVYSSETKASVLGVPRAVLDEHGPVSGQTAAHLAAGTARLFDADLGISATGVAGPADHDGEPPGTIFVGVSWRHSSDSQLVRGYGDRDNVRGIAVTAALDFARRTLATG
jgi:nicotinamide-nucleotide amidase